MAECDEPFAIIAEQSNALSLACLNLEAEEAGLARGMSLSDARSILPNLITRPAAPAREQAALLAFARWAGRFSPFAAIDGAEALALDITGCAHLFGGEAGLLEAMIQGAAALGLSARAGLADTYGAAWALARYAPGQMVSDGAAPGDGVAPDAHATRVRTPRRRKWARPVLSSAEQGGAAFAIAAQGGARAAVNPLPLAALRLAPEIISRMQRLGLRRVEDLTLTPRAALARRFGTEVPLRLDQALGAAPEPIAPLTALTPLAARISFPEPIGLISDIEAALARLLAQVCKRLKERGLGARRLQYSLSRTDGVVEHLEIGLARPSRDPDRIAPLFVAKIEKADIGFGLDIARLSVTSSEPLIENQHSGHLAARDEATARFNPGGGQAFADLLSRIGARIGLENLIRPLPADSHIPEKEWINAAAAYSEPPVGGWNFGQDASGGDITPPVRPVCMFHPEIAIPVSDLTPNGDSAQNATQPPASFRWRRREWRVVATEGPERIAPEWWLDDPAWRAGPRDYWRVECEHGHRLWLFRTHTGETSGGWFVHGELA